MQETTITPYQKGAGRIMITNGGPHPPESWAQVTAEHIAPIAVGLAGTRYVAAMKLQMAITEALTPHHQAVQHHEREKLAGDPAHVMTDLDPSAHLDVAMQAIIDAAAGTEWEAHFAQPDVQAVIRQELGAHFATAQHIERSWHVDRNPAHPHAAAWRAQHSPGG